MINCNEKPKVIGTFTFDNTETEVMNYLYFPIFMAGKSSKSFVSLEPRLEKYRKMIQFAIDKEEYPFKYIYLSAKTMYVGPGITGNRPGWHCDGFGTEDITYVWADQSPTLFSHGEFNDISTDHNESLKQFEEIAEKNEIYSFPVNSLIRLTPRVVHHTPKIWEPGLRSFVKISFSDLKYNLKGNTKNYMLDTSDWKLYDRKEIRNDPVYSNTDHGPQK